MAEEMTGNLLVAQIGDASPALNAALAGVVNEALNHGCIEEIYGALHGLQGLANEEIIDLAEESQQVIRGLSYTPGAALGGGRGLPRQDEDWERLIDVLQAHEIRFLVLCGGGEAIEAAAGIDAKAAALGYRLCTLAVPVALDNSVPLTDHCPGYGSAIKDLSLLTKALAASGDAQGQHDTVTVVEVSGVAAGWVAAGASLARRRNQQDDPPHILLLPERPLDSEAFLSRVQEVLRQQSSCLVLACEGIVDPDGNYVTAVAPTDPLAGYAGAGVAHLLRGLIEQNLGGLRLETFRYQPLQRLGCMVLSQVDIDEAMMSGSAAVKACCEGTTGKFVGLVRTDSDTYGVETTLLSLNDAAGRYKPLPDPWLDETGMDVSYQFFKYANPLIQDEVQVPFENGLPKFIKVAGNRVTKVLPS